MFDNKTHGIDIQNEYIKLEEDILDDISCRSNTTVVAFFDCCRNPLKDVAINSSKINENSSTESQYIVQYTSKVGNQSFANHDNKFSYGTEALLKHFESYDEQEIDIYNYIQELVYQKGERRSGASKKLSVLTTFGNRNKIPDWLNQSSIQMSPE